MASPTSDLLKLPLELRLLIYEHYFHDIKQPYHTFFLFASGTTLRHDLRLIQQACGLLCTSHSILYEALPVFEGAFKVRIAVWAKMAAKLKSEIAKSRSHWRSGPVEKAHGRLRAGRDILESCLQQWSAIEGSMMVGSMLDDGMEMNPA